ncbi:hypothetical protein PanWU01x14_132750 [Parasponia andersonii]|uniref:Uncharacterized protein n=1 Tax=Parasponia andersonii TaxID=3476 RepID=A0A2P5CQ77_PARAD|nr:hypothetical protein PanWU01x14_132750 [Parasponia andersonii]
MVVIESLNIDDHQGNLNCVKSLRSKTLAIKRENLRWLTLSHLERTSSGGFQPSEVIECFLERDTPC